MKIQDVGFRNVISITSRRKTMIYAALSQVEAYWDALRGDQMMPPRSAVDPRGIEVALEYAFILECVAPGIARFRLAGMHLSDLMGMEVRGMPVTAMFAPEARKIVSETISEICTRPQLTHLTLKGERSIGRPALQARMFLAPLTDDFGAVNRILGCIQSEGSIGRQPRRFKVSEVTTRPLASAATQESPLPDPHHAGFAETPRHFGAEYDTKKPDATRPALRLVASND